MKMRDAILDVLRTTRVAGYMPGLTGYEIHRALAERHWSHRWFGRDTIPGMLLGPSTGRLYVALWELENEGIIVGTWGAKADSRYRPRYYTMR